MCPIDLLRSFGHLYAFLLAQYDLYQESDATLRTLEELGGAGEITLAAAARRGLSAGVDAQQTRLAAELRRALDPGGVLR